MCKLSIKNYDLRQTKIQFITWMQNVSHFAMELTELYISRIGAWTNQITKKKNAKCSIQNHLESEDGKNVLLLVIFCFIVAVNERQGKQFEYQMTVYVWLCFSSFLWKLFGWVEISKIKWSEKKKHKPRLLWIQGKIKKLFEFGFSFHNNNQNSYYCAVFIAASFYSCLVNDES